ncbi:MAG: PQQ-binding-like beta-propeller repeat protein [Rickettsiales bacterium]
MSCVSLFRVFACVAATAFALQACSLLPEWMGGEKEEKKLKGERVSLFSEENAIHVAKDGDSVPFVIPAQKNITSWPRSAVTFSDRPDHPALAERLEEKFTADFDLDNEDEGVYVPPVVVMDTIYTLDAEGVVRAFGGQKFREKLWQTKLTKNDEGYFRFGGLGVYQGNVYVNSGGNALYALDAKNGRILWSKRVSGVLRGAPAFYGNSVIAATLTNRLYALSLKDGETLWSHEATEGGVGYVGTASPTVYRDAVLAAYSSGDVYVLRADTGEAMWSRNILSDQDPSRGRPNVGDVGVSPQVYAGYVILAARAGHLSVNDLPSGGYVWKMNVKIENEPWAAAEYLYGITGDNELFALHVPTSTIRWKYGLGLYKDAKEKKGRRLFSAPVLAGNRLYVASADETLYAFSPEDGKEKAEYDIPKHVYHSPIAVSGRLMLMAPDGKLTVFGEK